MTNSSYITTESGGRQNIFPTEPRPYIDQSVSYDGYPQNAEKVNGRWAMIGLVALLGAYVTTGQIIPGIFYFREKASPHLLPILFNPKQLKDELLKKVDSLEIKNS